MISFMVFPFIRTPNSSDILKAIKLYILNFLIPFHSIFVSFTTLSLFMRSIKVKLSPFVLNNSWNIASFQKVIVYLENNTTLELLLPTFIFMNNLIKSENKENLFDICHFVAHCSINFKHTKIKVCNSR